MKSMKKLLVWGMGEEAKKFIMRLKNSEAYEIVAITDSFVSTEEGSSREIFLGIPIVTPEQWKRITCDYIIAASSRYRDEITKAIHELLPETNKILSIEVFDNLNIFQNEYQEHIKNNELYQYFMNGNHGTMTKWLHYFRVYDKYFSRFRGTDVVICEIGVWRGASLQMWKEYFGQKATIIGIDINPECKKYECENIKIEIGSQENPEFWDYIKKKYERIDILLDDGGHTMRQQISTFIHMFPFLSNGGVYVCEDTHTSYWKDYGGGYKGNSFIEYSKNLVDDIHAYHSQCEDLQPSYYTNHIFGIHYYNSMVVLEKERTCFLPFSLIKGEDEN